MRWAYVGPCRWQNLLDMSIADFKGLYSGNTGNLLYYFATRALLAFDGGSYGARGVPLEYLNSNDGLVLSLANHLGAHVDMSRSGFRIENSNNALLALGLGAQAESYESDISYIPSGSVEYLKRLAMKSVSDDIPNITVRGEYTLSVIEKLGLADSAIVTGCHTNFLNPNTDLGERIFRFYGDRGMNRVSVAAGNVYSDKFRVLESSLMALADETGGDYVIQHPVSLISLAARFDEASYDLEFEKFRSLMTGMGFSESFLHEFIKKRFKVYSDAPQWLRSHRQSDVVVGTRIHGVQSALQAGVPAICLFKDSRTQELCETMRIPHADAKLFDHGIALSEIEEIFLEWDFEAYDKRRLELAERFVTFLSLNKVSPSKRLTSLTNKSPSPQ